MTTDAYTPSAQDVKALRERTGAGMMDCKKALVESGGDVEQAIEILRKKAGKRIEDRGERTAAEGTIQTYIHSNAKVGVLVEVNCETDFVARNDDFVAFARDIALHIAAANPLYVTEEDVDPAARDKEAKVFEEQAVDKPENIRPKIVEGQLKKWLGEIVLLNQVHVNEDKYEGKTIKQLQDEVASKTGENVRIRSVRAFRRRPVAAARAGVQADPAEAVGRGPHGLARVRHRRGSRPGDRGPDRPRPARGRRGRGRRRRGQHLPRPAGRGDRHGPGDGRLHGHARDGAQRAASSRTRWRSRTSTRACSRRSRCRRSPSRTSAAARCATSRRGAS